MVDYCTRIFGKSLRELSYQDIENYFIEPKEENEYLEFKSGQGDFENSFINNIIRTIVGFLNSSGGVLIWGSPKDTSPKKGEQKVTVGDLIPLTISKAKDNLINRISTSISYMPKGINVEKLEKEGKFVYIFEIQESESKPHQYSEKGIYYIRLDGQTKPAPHYVIDALFKQIKFADIDGKLNFVYAELFSENLIIEIEAKLSNNSKYIIGNGIEISLHTSVGRFTQNNDKDLAAPNTYSLHYGPPKTLGAKIKIDLTNIDYEEKELNITMFFAGNNSNAKVCNYVFDLEKIINIETENGILELNDYLIESSENHSFID
ncbi:AlbA family DNA-binding domain-containing protein [Sphingobacterium kyonggiense]